MMAHRPSHQPKRALLPSMLLVLSALLCTLATPIRAQTGMFRNYTGEDGLVQSQVSSLIQDRRGRLWAATDHGISRFDGLAFTNFSRADGMAENSISSLHADREGRIWIGHELGGITLRQDERFSVVSDAEDGPRGRIVSITEDRAGRIWFASLSDGLWMATEGPGPTEIERIASPVDSINVVYATMDRLWVGSSRGLFSVLGEAGVDGHAKEGYRWHGEGGKTLLNRSVSALWQDDRGRLWIGSADGRLFVLLPSDEKSDEKGRDAGDSGTRELRPCSGIPRSPITDVASDADGYLWVATQNRGAWRLQIHPQNGRVTECRVFTVQEGLSYNHVSDLLLDREGSLWLATFGAGICRYEGRSFEITRLSDDPETNSVWDILEDQRGTIWFGTEGGILRYQLHSGDRNHPQTRLFNTADGLAHNAVRSLAEDREEMLWLATKGGGLCRFDPRTEEFLDLGITDGLPTDKLLSLARGTENDLWIGTLDEGIVRFTLPHERTDPRGQSWRFEHFALGNPGHRPSVYAMLRDRQGEVWAAVLGQGLGQYIPSSENGQGYFRIFAAAAGLSDLDLSGLAEDEDGKLWVSTFNGYLYSFDGSRFEEIGNPDDFRGDTIYLVACDRRNEVLVGTNTGLYKYDRPRDHFTHFHKSHSFLSTETNVNAVCTEESGHIWFGTISGAIHYDPEAQHENPIAPRISITGVSIYLDPVAMVQPARFAHDQNHITFDFLGISLSAPEEVRYRYKLAGFDKDWLPITERRYVTYSGLPHGSYRFMVAAANRDGIWSPQPAIFAFSVQAPFWRTLWFYLACVLALVGLITGMHRRRTSSLKRTNRELESRVRARTEEIRQRNREIERVNQALQSAVHSAEEAARAKATFLATMSHEIRTPLNGVLGMTELLLHSDLDLDQQECAGAIHSSGSALLSVLNDVLDLSKAEAGRIELQPVDFDCRDVIVEVVDLFAPQAQEKDIDLAYIVAPDIPRRMTTDPHRLRQVLSNLVGNAIKFTDQGQIIVRAELQPHVQRGKLLVRFKVCDSGVGISAEGLAHLFEPFSQVDGSYARTHRGTGLGLAICRQLVQRLGGEIEVSSESGEGSCFSFSIVADGTPAARMKPVLRGKLIYVAGDNAPVLEIVREQLAAAGAEALISTSLPDLFELPGSPDRILVDEKMLRREGTELGRRLHEEPSLDGCGLVAIVPFGKSSARDFAGDLPKIATITKPLHEEQLISLLSKGSVRAESPLRRPRLEELAHSIEDTRVLIADDNDINLTVAERMLRKLGCLVSTASGGAEAIEMLRQGQLFDIIFMDCQMPGVDGFEATRRIRELEAGAHTPIVALTANAMPSDLKACLDAGMDDHQSKPLSIAELAARIEKWAVKRAV